MRPLRIIALVLVAALFVHAAVVYERLPERIPTHSNVAGEVDRWQDRTPWRAVTIPLAALAVVGLVIGAGVWSARDPKRVNIPDREKLVRLPARFRAPVMERVADVTDAAAVVVALVFAMVQWEFTRVALAGGGRTSVVVLVLPMLLSVGLLILVSRVTTALDEADRAWRAAGSPEE